MAWEIKKRKRRTGSVIFIFISDRTEKQGTKELQKYVNKYGNQDYGLTDEVQKTLYVTATFVTELEKSLLFQLSNKAFFFLALLVSGNFALFVKTASELPDYRKRYEFLSCMGITKKMKKRTLAMGSKTSSGNYDGCCVIALCRLCRDGENTGILSWSCAWKRSMDLLGLSVSRIYIAYRSHAWTIKKMGCKESGGRK